MIGGQGYVPNNQDILNCRIMTTSVLTTRLNISGIPMVFIDVGGHRSFRFKWAPYLCDNLKSIFFVFSLSCYDQVLAEDDETNRMEDAIELFRSLARNKNLKGISITVFLNKVDLYEKKVVWSPIEKYFPTFKFKENDKLSEAGIAYFKRRFSIENTGRLIQHNVTKATDQQLMMKVLHSVIQSIMHGMLKNYGML